MQNETHSSAHRGTRTGELDAEYASRTEENESDGRDEAEVLGGSPSMRRGVDTQSPSQLHTAADETFGDTDLYADQVIRGNADGQAE